MSESITGQCHCGSVKYAVHPPKMFEFLCHCSSCRKLNSGGHLSGAMYPAASLQVEGETTQYSYPGGSGKNIEAHFCPKCGTTVYAFPLSHPEGVVIRANTLDEPNQFQPQQSLFAENAFPWDKAVIQQA